MKIIYIIILLTLTLTACSSNPSGSSATPLPTEAAAPTATVTESPTPSPSPNPTEPPTPTPTPSPTESISDSITRNINTITTHKTQDYLTITDLVNLFPNEFNEILTLGEDAIPYLNEIIRTDMNHRDFITSTTAAMTAIYLLNPEEYDIIVPSPDGKYYLESKASSFIHYTRHAENEISHDTVSLIEAATNTVIWEHELGMFDVRLRWSPCSRYAAVSSSMRWFSITNILDTETLEYLPTPRVNDILEYLPDGFPVRNTYFREHFLVTEWVTDGQVKIYFQIRDLNDLDDEDISREFMIVGGYVYDLDVGLVWFEYDVYGAF